MLDGNAWVINGSKIFITNAATKITAGVTVLGPHRRREDGKPELSCILVEAGTPGFSAETDAREDDVARLPTPPSSISTTAGCPEDNLLGPRGEGFHQMLQTLDGGRLSIAAMGLGGAQGRFDRSIKYANQREAVRPPHRHLSSQRLQAGGHGHGDRMRALLLYKACWLRDNSMPFAKEAAMAKLYCSEVMYRCANHAVQLHGGYGLMKEYEVERFYRDQKLLEIGEGTSEVQRIVIARHIGAKCL